MKIKGVDISSWQGNIDFDKVKADGVKFAIIRCGYGSDLQSQDDKYFEANVRGCERVGIPWGVYLYSYARNLQEAQSEVNHVLRLIKGKKPHYPVYIDMEDADGYKAREKVSNSTCSGICDLFCVQVEKAGFYPGIYANKYWLDTKLDSKVVAKWDTWLAQWTSAPSYKGDFEVWQYTSGGEVGGISGRVDMNLCYVDYPEIIKAAELNGWGKDEEKGEANAGSNVEFGVGDEVYYAGRLYKDSFGSGAGKAVDGLFLVSQYIKNRAFGVLLGGNLGWVQPEKCSLEQVGSSQNIAFKMGDVVKIRDGVSAFYDGVIYAEFLKGRTLYVRQILPDRILVSTLSAGDVTGWFHKGDLILAK